MALSRELIEHERLRELAIESDLLRGSLSQQCTRLRTPGFWIEQGVSVAVWWLGPESRIGRVLSIATSFFL